MNRLELVYLAGFIDGEGCIGLVPVQGYGKRAHNTTSSMQVRLSATNTNITPLNLCKKCFGGCITPHHKPERGRKDCWRWTLPSQKAINAILELRPYLRVKHKQADLIIEFSKTFNENAIERTHKKGRFINNVVKSNILQKRQRIAQKLNILNRR